MKSVSSLLRLPLKTLSCFLALLTYCLFNSIIFYWAPISCQVLFRRSHNSHCCIELTVRCQRLTLIARERQAVKTSVHRRGNDKGWLWHFRLESKPQLQWDLLPLLKNKLVSAKPTQRIKTFTEAEVICVNKMSKIRPWQALCVIWRHLNLVIEPFLEVAKKNGTWLFELGLSNDVI